MEDIIKECVTKTTLDKVAKIVLEKGLTAKQKQRANRHRLDDINLAKELELTIREIT